MFYSFTNNETKVNYRAHEANGCIIKTDVFSNFLCAGWENTMVNIKHKVSQKDC